MTTNFRDALDAAMEDDTLTDQERRNLTAVREWRSTWVTDAARLVDACYADSTEVYLPFQGFYFVKPGESKEKWRVVEIAAEKLWQHREMNFLNVIARGDTVALETGPSTPIDKNGNTRGSKLGGAIFLKFDQDGRIISDHTFMRTAGEKKDPTSVRTLMSGLLWRPSATLSATDLVLPSSDSLKTVGTQPAGADGDGSLVFDTHG